MKTKYITLFIGCLILLFTSCSEDDVLMSDPFVVAFKSLSKNLTEINTDTSINLVYSELAEEDGNITILINPGSAIYGQDFITVPEAVNNSISIPISTNENEAILQFKKLNTTLDETTKIQFSISEINYTNANIQGNSVFEINSSPNFGGSILAEVGGPNQQNQVYVDLSTQSTKLVQRDSWDLGFYNGDDFRVTINGSIYMAAKALSETNIDAVNENSVTGILNDVAVGTFNPDNANYIDNPNGNILEIAIAEISEVDSNNPVYLVNMGYTIGTATPTIGSVAIAGEKRGWKKIRILRNGTDYILQYADLDAAFHQEVTIPKQSDFNFSHFSFNTNNLVSVAPKKEKWDICFTVFTNLIEGSGSYGFSDYVIQNRKGNTEVYQIINENEEAYTNFSLVDVDTSLFSLNQTSIGSNWRDVFSREVYKDRFYILKDANNNIYKIRFLTMTNDNGERGYPEFEYNLLQ